jgi:hypothetical protein
VYIGPESGDDATLKRIAKGATHAEHVAAAHKRARGGDRAQRDRAAGDRRDGAGAGARGGDGGSHHRDGPAVLRGADDDGDPEHAAAPPAGDRRFALPTIDGMLLELRTIVDRTRPSDAVFRTNHASNYLPLSGKLPDDRERIVETIDRALAGQVLLRPEWARGL